MGVSEVFRTAPDPLAPRHLLSVGKLIAGKGHERVIDAAAHARHRWPVVVAAGGEQDRPAEVGLAARARLHGVDLTVRSTASGTPSFAISTEARSQRCTSRGESRSGSPHWRHRRAEAGDRRPATVACRRPCART